MFNKRRLYSTDQVLTAKSVKKMESVMMSFNRLITHWYEIDKLTIRLPWENQTINSSTHYRRAVTTIKLVRRWRAKSAAVCVKQSRASVGESDAKVMETQHVVTKENARAKEMAPKVL